MTLLAPPTNRSILPEARHLVIPAGIVSSGLPAVRKTCGKVGLTFDSWQVETVRLLEAKDLVDQYAADTVVLSIPRQVGKTFVVGAVAFARCIITPNTTVVWTAHRFKVARETFMELKSLALRPAMAAHIDPDAITTAAGNECILFRNGSRIVSAARERGSIRGFTKVDLLVLDEGQILTEAAMSDLVPTQNQADNPQVIIMGTPPKPADPGEVFTNLRQEALDGTSDGVLYIEFSSEEDCETDDLAAWHEANPSLGTRTKLKAIRRLRKLLSEPDFRREALGIWPSKKVTTVFDLKHWADLAVAQDQPKASEFGLALDITPDRSSGSVSFAARMAGGEHDGHRLAEVIRTDRGSHWMVPLIVELRTEKPDVQVMLDATGPAGSLIDDLRKEGITTDNGLIIASARDMAQACGSFYDGVIESTVHHIDQPALNVAIGVARKRMIGDGGAWAWHRKDPTVDISPLVSCTLALAALERPPKPKKKRAGKYW